MNIGMIGYGSMGKMLTEQFAESEITKEHQLFVSTRTKQKLENAPVGVHICENNCELAAVSDIVFLCLRPAAIREVMEEISPCLSENALFVSLNGSISFEILERLTSHKLAKVIPSVTAEIKRSQTLVCYNSTINSDDKALLESILSVIGDVTELSEAEMEMGSELVSCMPGFIAAIFDVICTSAGHHTEIPLNQIIDMVLKTLNASSELMLKNKMSFHEVVDRVATKGGITEVGADVIYHDFPKIADELFQTTLAKRRETAEKAKAQFEAFHMAMWD